MVWLNVDSPQFSMHTQALKQVSMFAALGDVKVERLARVCRHRHFERASTIVNPGQAADGVYVLLAGRAKVVIEDADGRQMTLGMFEAHELFGEMSLFGEREWVAGVRAHTPCEALYIPKWAFLECIEGNFDAAIFMLRASLARLRKADRKIESLGLLDVYTRVARFLVEAAEEVNGEQVVTAGMKEIASSVAASREMVNRVMNKMKSKGLLRRENRNPVIVGKALMMGATADTSG